MKNILFLNDRRVVQKLYNHHLQSQKLSSSFICLSCVRFSSLIMQWIQSLTALRAVSSWTDNPNPAAFFLLHFHFCLCHLIWSFLSAWNDLLQQLNSYLAPCMFCPAYCFIVSTDQYWYSPQRRKGFNIYVAVISITLKGGPFLTVPSRILHWQMQSDMDELFFFSELEEGLI